MKTQIEPNVVTKMSAVKGQYDFKNSEQLTAGVPGPRPATSFQHNSVGFHDISQASLYPRAQGCLNQYNNSSAQQISTQDMMLSNLNANLQDQFAANHSFNRTAPSTASLQIRGQQAPVLSQKMVRNFSGLGYQNGR